MLVLVFAACGGLFGDGAMSNAQVMTSNGFHYTYPRYMRRTRSDQILLAARSSDSTFTLSLQGLGGSGFVIDEITPVPAEQVATAAGESLRWRVEPNAVVRIVLTVTPRRSGHIAFVVQSEDKRTVLLPIFVFP